MVKHHRTEKLTQQMYASVKKEITRLTAGQPVVVGTNEERGKPESGNAIAIVGSRPIIEHLVNDISQLIIKIEIEIEKENSITEIRTPNIPAYQIEYMILVKAFDRWTKEFNLESINSNASQEEVKIRGTPKGTNAANKELLELLTKLNQSKAIRHSKSLFLAVIKTESATEAIRLKFLNDNIVAVWTIESKAICIYSSSQAVSQAALKCINAIIWEEQYPASRPLNHMEKELLKTPSWVSKKTHLEQLFQPLEIFEQEDIIFLASLENHKESIMEDVPRFFRKNVRHTSKFPGNPERVCFIQKFMKEQQQIWEAEHNVTLSIGEKPNSITIEGTEDNIANCTRALTREHNAICKDIHVIQQKALIDFIAQEPDFYDDVGRKTSCLVVPHNDSLAAEAVSEFQFSIELKNGSVCEVKNVDITTMTCDAIVNPANTELCHVDGLAHAIVQKGNASDGFQLVLFFSQSFVTNITPCQKMY